MIIIVIIIVVIIVIIIMIITTLMIIIIYLISLHLWFLPPYTSALQRDSSASSLT